MASARSLAILAGVTALLVLALVWDVARPGRDVAPGSRRLVPACDSVARVVWERPGQAPVALEGQFGLAYELLVSRQAPAGALRVPADERVIDDVLGTLELLSPRRALPASRAERGLDPPRLRIHVTCRGGRTTTLALGHRIASMDRVWLARPDADTDQPGTDYLIEGHAARALDRSLDDLRARRPFAGLAASLTSDGLSGDADIELRQGSRALALLDRHTILDAGLDVDAEPAQLVEADLGQVSALVRRLRDLVLVRFVEGAPDAQAEAGAAPLSIRAHDADNLAATLEELGPCPPAAPPRAPAPPAAPAAPASPASPASPAPDGVPDASRDLRLVRTHLGTGCVAADALAAVAAFLDQPQRMISRRLLDVPGSWERVRVYLPGVVLTLEPRGGDVAMVVDYEGAGSEFLTAERAAVDEWLAALAAVTGGAIVRPAALGQSPEVEFSVVVAQSGVERLVEISRDPRSPAAAPRWLALRGGEPILLAIDADLRAAGVLPVELTRFLPRTLLVREPFALREVSARERGRVSEHLVRGELLDDWAARAPARASVRPGIVDSLRQTLARLRAVRFVAEAPAPAHRLTPPRRRVEVVFDPGPLDAGVPFRDRLELGADTPGGCLARLDTGKPGPVFELDRRTCDTLLGPWTRRDPQ